MAKDYNKVLKRVPENAIAKAFAEAYEAAKGWVPSAGAVLHAANHPKKSAEASYREWVQGKESKRLALPEPTPTPEQVDGIMRNLYRAIGADYQRGSVVAYVLIWILVVSVVVAVFSSIAGCDHVQPSEPVPVEKKCCVLDSGVYPCDSIPPVPFEIKRVECK